MIIALDIGGTKIAAALVDGAAIVERRNAPSTVHSDLSQLIPTVRSLCLDWVEQAAGVGVACTGMVGADDVHFLAAGADKIVPLKAQLSQAFGLPVVMLNDAWAAAWGEYCLGHHTDTETLVYITVSTGIGGGVIQNGKLLSSASGFAAHLGHVTVPRPNGDNFRCTCGRWNCAEAIASGSAIGRRASQLLGRKVSCREAFTLIDSCPELNPLLDDCAAAVAELIANSRAITGTDVVVLGGSVGRAVDFKFRVQQALAALPELYHVILKTPALGSDADTLGAALMVQEQLSSSSLEKVEGFGLSSQQIADASTGADSAERQEIDQKNQIYYAHKKGNFESYTTQADVVMVGDSITDAAEWQEMFAGITIVNRGISGDTTEGLLNRLQGVIRTGAKKAFIMIGVNDFTYTDSVDEVFKNYQQVVETLVAAGIDPYIQSTIQVGPDKTEYSLKIAELNRRLGIFATENGIIFIDLNRVLAPAGTLEESYSLDQVHLNANGYIEWKKILQPYLVNVKSG